jgi:hypothetical protein
VADDVPDIIARLATPVNAATDASLEANAPTVPAKEGTTPIATKPGQLTQFDIWQAPCTGILGNKYILAGYDQCSTDFLLYHMKKKSQTPRAAKQYYIDNLADGIKVDEGGTMWRDNEIVLNSNEMDEEVIQPFNLRDGNAN